MVDKKDKKILKTRERVYQEVVKSKKDLFTLKSFMVKKKMVESGNKFDRAIEMLQKEGRLIVKKGYAFANPKDLFKGTFFSKGKSGYVLIDGDYKHYRISEGDSKGLKTHDRVSVAFTNDGFSRLPFIVSTLTDDEEKSLINRLPASENGTVLGRVAKLSHDELVFIPNDKRFTKNIRILNAKNTLSNFQDKICLMQIAEYEQGDLPACGVITEIKGDAGNPIHEYEAIAAEHGAIMSWTDDERLQREIDKIPTTVDLSNNTLVNQNGEILQQGGGEEIVDLRDLAFSTVDPATCKDMDDAIYSTIENGELVVYTAVANVSKYVDLQSEIGKRYLQGEFTTYAPNRAYNILPPQLSTGICSLNPNVDRLAFVVRTVIDEKTGLPISSKIMDGVIQSREKYSYERAQEIYDNSDLTYEQLKEKIKRGETLTKDERVVFNAQAADILWKGFGKRNMLNFETKNEYDVQFNEAMDDIVDISLSDDSQYHQVIEAFMLTANEATAKFAKEHHIPNIYRVHDEPNEEKIAQANEFFTMLGLRFDGDLSPMGTERILSQVRGTSKEKMVNNFLVRMQNKAIYSTTTNAKQLYNTSRSINGRVLSKKEKQAYDESLENMEQISHFGLQSKAYSHATSPIRRVPDYITHYNILAYLKGKKGLSEQTIFEISAWANEVQESNKLAEREFNEVNSAIYCENHVGDVMKGRVCSFRKMGAGEGVDNIAVVVENEEKGIRVILPLREVLPGNLKNVEISTYGSAIVSKKSKTPVLRLCQDITFKIVSANRITREIFATTSLEAATENDMEQNVMGGIETNYKPVTKASERRQKMLANREYESTHNKNYNAINEERGKKHIETVKNKTGMQVSGKDAYKYNKQSSLNYKRKKQELNSSDKNFDENYFDDKD